MALPTYLSADEKAFASKVHIAAFAQKDTSKRITDPNAKEVEISGTKGKPFIQDVQPPAQKTIKDTLYAAIDLTVARATPTWDTVANKWIAGWTNGKGA